MQGAVGPVPTLSTAGGTVFLWACICLLIALCLILVIVSIIFGGNGGRGAARKTRKEVGGTLQEVLPRPD
jgi:hypothetical protein